MSTTPRRMKYQPIVDEFKTRIETSMLLPGDRLPSYAEMQAAYGLGLNTVNRVFIELEQQGLVERRQGSGVFVANPRQAPKTSTIAIGFGMDSINGAHYWFHLLQGIQNAAERHGLHKLLPVSMSSMPWEQFDGILLHGGRAPGNIPRPLLMPAVSIMISAGGMPCALADEAQGVELAVDHLVELGHRRIGYLGWHDRHEIQGRTRAYRKAIARHGLARPRSLERCMKFYGDCPPSQYHYGYTNMVHWLDEGFRKTGCTALLVHNDQHAIGVIRALQDAGLRVPEDVSIVGFDGTEEAERTRPSLTTVLVPLERIADTAVDLLARCIRDERVANEPVVLPVELRVGQSTGAVNGE